jgi:hypothetical protein
VDVWEEGSKMSEKELVLSIIKWKHEYFCDEDWRDIEDVCNRPFSHFAREYACVGWIVNQNDEIVVVAPFIRCHNYKLHNIAEIAREIAIPAGSVTEIIRLDDPLKLVRQSA